MTNSKISALTSATTPLAGSETLPVVQSSTTKQVSVANLTAGRLVNASGVTVTGNFISGVGGTGTALGSLYLNGGSGGGGGFIQGQQNSAATWFLGDTVTALGSGTGLIEYIYSGAPKITYIQGTGEITRTVATGLQITTGNVTMSTAAKGVNFTANTPAAGMTSQLLNWYEEGTWTPTFFGWTGTYATQIGKYTRIGRQLFLEAVIITNGGTGTFSQTYPNVQGLPFAIQYLGAGAVYGQWFGVSGFSVGATNTSSGTFDYASANEFFCNITGINTAGVGNLTNGMLSNASNVAMRIIATYII